MLFKANNLQRSFLWTLSVSGGVLWPAKHWTGLDYDNLESIMSSETLGCNCCSFCITDYSCANQLRSGHSSGQHW